MDVSQAQLSVEPVIPPKDMVNENVDHIGVMAYAAWHRHTGKTCSGKTWMKNHGLRKLNSNMETYLNNLLSIKTIEFQGTSF